MLLYSVVLIYQFKIVIICHFFYVTQKKHPKETSIKKNKCAHLFL